MIDKLNDDHNQNVEIKMEAAGALRNLAIEGGAEVCAEVRSAYLFVFLSLLLFAHYLFMLFRRC